MSSTTTSPAVVRDVTKQIIIAYEKNHGLIPEGLTKVLGGKVKFVEHKLPTPASPSSPITSFLTGESDLFLTNKCQLAHLQGCTKIAVYGGSSQDYLLAPVSTIPELQASRLVHGFLVHLYKMHPDMMLYPIFALRYASIEAYQQELQKDSTVEVIEHHENNPKSNHYNGDMD